MEKPTNSHPLNGHNSKKLAQISLKVPPFDSPCPCASYETIHRPLAICFDRIGFVDFRVKKKMKFLVIS